MREFLETIVQFARIASRDEYRGHMTGVCVDGKDGHVRLRATNGHALAERSFPEVEHFKAPEAPVFISQSEIETLEFMVKRRPVVLGISFTVGRLNIMGQRGHAWVVETQPADFPDTDKIKPAKEREEFEIALNPELLMELARAMGHLKGQPVMLRFSKEYLAPIRVLHQSGSEGIVMPYRTKAVDT